MASEVDNPYLSLLDEDDDEQTRRLRGTLSSALGTKPDRYAVQRQVARYLGYPTSVVEAIPDTEMRAQIQGIDEATADAPATRRKLIDIEFAKLAHDDVPNLSSVERVFGSGQESILTSRQFSSLVQQIKSENPAFTWDQARAFASRRAGIDNQSALIGKGAPPSPTIPNVAEGIKQSVASGLEQARQGIRLQMADALEALTGVDMGGAREDALKQASRAKFAAEIAAPAFETKAGDLAFGGAANVAQNLPALAAAIATRNPNLAAALASVQTEAQAYEKYSARGATGAQAIAGAVSEGTIEFLTEKIPLSFLAENVGRMPLWKLFLGDQAREQVTEQIATHTQDIVDALVANPDMTVAQYLRDRPDAALRTAVAVLMQGVAIGGAQAGVGPVVERARRKDEAARIAERNAGLLEQLDQLAAASKVRQRDPDTFEDFVRSAAEDGPVTHVYVDAQTLAQSPNLEALAAVSPSIAAQLPQALATGGTVQIPVEEYATHIAGTELNQGLIDELRTEPDGFSRREAQEFMQSQAEDLRAEVERAIAQKADDDTFKASIAQVKEQIKSQLDATSRFTPEVHDAYATMMSHFFGVMGAKVGMSPDALFAEYPLKIGAESLGGKELDQFGSKVVGTTPEWWNAPSENRFAPKGTTKGDEIMDWLKRHKVEQRNGKYVFYHATPKNSGVTDGLREGSYLETDPDSAAHFAARDRDLKRDQLKIAEVLLDPWQIEPGVFAQLREDVNGLVFNQAVSTRVPWAKPRGKNPPPIENPLSARLQVGLEAFQDVPEALENAVALLTTYPNWRPAWRLRNTNAKVERFVGEVVSNLLWLHDQVPAEIRARSRKWYDGANVIAGNFADRYGITLAQASAVLAVNSPQTEWFTNVSRAERILDIWFNRQDFSWSPEMDETAARILGKEQYADDLAQIRGKTLADLSGDSTQQAMWLRVYDESHNDRGHRIVTPEGSFGDWVTNADGETRTKTAWASLGHIAKSIEVLRDGSVENISARLGNEHKVRSFYNNIFAPNDPVGDVTIDTHAVAAGLLRPLAGSDIEVVHNLGGGVSNALKGLSGTYGIYAEAYRRAAAQRGILPREMQSITWEAVRGLYTDVFKSSAAAEQVEQTWRDFRAGRVDEAGVRARVLELSGGVNEPNWWQSDRRPPTETWSSSYGGELSAFRVSGPAAESSASGNSDGGRGGSEASAGKDGVLNQPAYTGDTIEVDGQTRPAANSKGQRIAETAEDIRNFWRWFGDSKVVDAEGRPLVVYHGTGADFAEFDPDTVGANYDKGDEKGFFFTSNATEAEWAASRGAEVSGGGETVMPAYLAIVDPLVENVPETARARGLGDPSSWYDNNTDEIMLAAEQGEHDGVIVRSASRGYGTFIAFNPEQIKSAVGNRGTFDPADANILNQSDATYWQSVADYQGTHKPPGPDTAPLSDLTANGIYPDDVYGVNGARWYGDGSGRDNQSFALAQRVKGRPNAAVTVYRAVPYEKTNAEKQAAIRKQMDAFMRRGIVPAEWGGSRTSLGDGQGFYDWATAELDRLAALPPEGSKPKRTINAGDWVTTSREYAKEHGEGALGGDYKIISKTVKAKEIFTNGDSIQEWGYWPEGSSFAQDARPAAERGFLQNRAQGNRGSFRPSDLTITLLKGADLSTFLHESGHFFLEVQFDLASRIGAKDAATLTPGERELLADTSALLKWFGVPDLPTWYNLDFEEQRSYHERFARGFESYLFEGKAPSIELHGLFQRFRAWLLNIYRELKNLNVEISDEVRGVFDRMLATNEEIKLAEQARSMLPLFESPDQAGMTVEEFAAYQALGTQATADAIEDLQSRGLRDMRYLHNARGRVIKRLQKQAEDLRREIRAEVRTEVMSRPVYRAWAFLTGREGKLEKTEADIAHESALDTWRTAREDAEKAALATARKEAWESSPESRREYENGRAQGMAKGQFLARNKKDIDLVVSKAMLEWDRANPKPERAKVEQAIVEGPDGPVYGKLDREAVKEMEGPAAAMVVKQRMTAEGGLHPDLVADMFGFSSGDELVKALAEATPPAEEIEGLTDVRMLQEHGELSSPEAIEREADRAIHNDVRARMVATEANALAKAMSTSEKVGTDKKGRPVMRPILPKAAREFAATMIARLKIRDLRPGQYTSAEVRAAREAAKASAAGDLATAAAEKRNQLVNLYAARAAYDAQDEINTALKYLRKFDSEGTRKGLDVDYLDQIDALLERFDLRAQSLKAIDKRTGLAAWIESQREQGIEPDLPPEILNDAFRTSYKDLTVEQFRGLVDSVQQIEHLGRLKKKLLTAKDQREYEAVRDEMVASITVNAQGRKANTRTPTTAIGLTLQQLRRFWASHIKAATWARIFDGGDNGPVWNYIIRPANARADMETTMRAEATKRLHEIMAPVFKLGRMSGSGQFFATIGRSLNRQERIAIALNVGNEGNLQRLLGGEGWQMPQLVPVLKSLTAAEWQAVQQVWDYLETFRPLIAEKERRVYGREPDWVEARAFDVTTADGQTLSLRGGYYPIKYDPAASMRAEQHMDAEEAQRQLRGAYTTATTRRSFTKARAEEVTGRPLLYNLSGMYSGVNDVIHDLAWHEWLIDVNRLLRSQSIDAAIRNRYGPEAKAQLKSWVADVAEGDRGAANAGEAMLGRLRQGVSAAGLGFNVMSAAMQPLGLTQSMVRIGTRWVGRGIARYVASPRASSRMVNEKSEFMRNRARTRFRELNELRNKVQDESAPMAAVKDGTFFLMMRAQQLVDIPTWIGAYEKAIADEQAEDRAVALADQAVIDAQGGGQLKDLSAIERGGPALKLFTVFYSFMNTALNLGVAQTMTPRSKARLAADYLLLFTVPAVLGHLLKEALQPGGADDDEDLVRELIAAQLEYLMGLMVVVREFAAVGRVASGAEGARDYQGPAGVRAIVDVVRLGQQAGQGEFDDAFRKAAVNVIGDFTGLPSAQVNKTITGAQAYSEGETDNPMAFVFGYSAQ